MKSFSWPCSRWPGAFAYAVTLFGRPWPVIAASSFVLAQVGEFAFILEKIGREAGLTPADRGEDGSQVFIAVTVLLIAITPLLFSAGRRMQRSMEDRSDEDSQTALARSEDCGRGRPDINQRGRKQHDGFTTD